MRRVIRTCWLLLAAACAAPVEQAYEGPRRPPNETALLRIPPPKSDKIFGKSVRLEIVAVDGAKRSGSVRKDLEVLPGTRVVTVRWMVFSEYAGRAKGALAGERGETSVEVRAEAGRIHELRPAPGEDGPPRIEVKTGPRAPPSG